MTGQESKSDEKPLHMPVSTDNTKEFVSNLEERLRSKSDKIEELHMEAAIDAEFCGMDKGEDQGGGDSGNPNSVANCLSPYVPTKAERIAAFVSWVGLKGDSSDGTGDILLDIGCGDGRVCTSAAKLSGCNSIGFDVSPLCIGMARDVAKEEGLSEEQCSFHQVDATVDPDEFLAGSSPLAKALQSVTVIFLYTYPTLLIKLVPLLARLTETGKVRAVVTLTYHLPEECVTLEKNNSEHDFRWYSHVQTR